MIRKIETKEIEELNKITDYKITVNDFSKCFVYLLDNKIVGFIDFELMYERAELLFIYVMDEYRNKGIASELLELLINTCKDCVNITLEVNINNLTAINLYEKFGFKKIGKREKYYHGIDAYLMERR